MVSSRLIALLRNICVLTTALPLGAQAPLFDSDAASAPCGGAGFLPFDLDGDGDIDLLGSTIATSALNDGTGHLTPGWSGTSPVQLTLAPSMNGFLQTRLLADLNGDGVPDLVDGASWLFPGAAWYAGSATGGFSTVGTQIGAPGQYFSYVDAGDVDGDGDVDLIANGAFFRNDGVGAFTNASTAVGWAAGTTWVAKLVDLDGDGDLDVVRNGVIFVDGTVDPSLVQENVGGVFAAPITLPPSPVPPQTTQQTQIVCADFDGDGLVDVVRYTSGLATVVMYRQSAPFAFAAGVVVPNPPGGPFVVKHAAAADLDGDGAAELLLVGDRGVATLREAGGAWLPHAPELPGAADVVLPFDADGDGDVDLFVGDATANGHCNHRFAFNLGGSVLEIPAGTLNALQGSTEALTGLADANPSGLRHALTFDGTKLYRSTTDSYGRYGPATLLSTSNAPLGYMDGSSGSGFLVVDDFDGDGDSDAMVFNVKMPAAPAQHCTTYLRNDGAAGFVGVVLHIAPSWYFRTADVATGDLNGDGLTDVVAAGASMRVFLSVSGSAPVLSTGQPPTTASSVSLGDFDADGDLDASLTTTAGFGAIWVNNGAGVFSLGPLQNPASGWSRTADYNGDGMCDLLFGDQLRLGIGPLQFAPPTPISSTYPGWLPVSRATDIDADGDVDLVFNAGSGLRNDGPAGFAATTWFTAPANSSVQVAQDLDLDGDLDFVISAGPRILRNRTRQLSARGPLRLGVPEVFEVKGPPGGVALLAVSYGESVPAVATPFGALALDVNSAAIMIVAPLDANGLAVGGAVLNPEVSAGLVGTTYFFQAVVDGDAFGPRLTNAFPLTVLPI
jgi:hypothetical protein